MLKCASKISDNPNNKFKKLKTYCLQNMLLSKRSSIGRIVYLFDLIKTCLNGKQNHLEETWFSANVKSFEGNKTRKSALREDPCP